MVRPLNGLPQSEVPGQRYVLAVERNDQEPVYRLGSKALDFSQEGLNLGI